jgi:hypothetical protein
MGFNHEKRTSSLALFTSYTSNYKCICKASTCRVLKRKTKRVERKVALISVLIEGEWVIRGELIPRKGRKSGLLNTSNTSLLHVIETSAEMLE